MTYTISKPDRHIKGNVYLDGSKSISNRALIIRALCRESFDIKNLSTSKDTQLMLQLLDSHETILDTGAAGTTFRFLTAYLASRPGSQILTGSDRMKQRPIGILVDALVQLGANIEYLERAGYPPLRIHPPKNLGSDNALKVPADTSSQYLSALLMIAPTLPNGLKLQVEGQLVSRPYVEMTLKIMEHFGVRHSWADNTITVPAQSYHAQEFTVEADWSAASYYYSMAALSESCDLKLHGLFSNSWQGDAVLGGMMQSFGVESVFSNNEVQLSKVGQANPFFEWDFLPCPDVAQTLAVICGGLGVHGLFSGLETLRIKETDRISALQNELAKVHVFFSKLPARFSKKTEREYYMVEGKAEVSSLPVFETYDDHRMAMAFAVLAMLGEIEIENPMVVEKSYPAFWEDLKKLGFVIIEG
ncbi:MAG: 3-phosphoshikimate 1-carboxyvinyltransferase [Saprospiraceae bacterium]